MDIIFLLVFYAGKSTDNFWDHSFTKEWHQPKDYIQGVVFGIGISYDIWLQWLYPYLIFFYLYNFLCYFSNLGQ